MSVSSICLPDQNNVIASQPASAFLGRTRVFFSQSTRLAGERESLVSKAGPRLEIWRKGSRLTCCLGTLGAGQTDRLPELDESWAARRSSPAHTTPRTRDAAPSGHTWGLLSGWSGQNNGTSPSRSRSGYEPAGKSQFSSLSSATSTTGSMGLAWTRVPQGSNRGDQVPLPRP